MIIKHLHMTFAVISVLLFSIRFLLTWIKSSHLEKKWLKITPHIIDSLLLAFGIALAVQLSLNPLEHFWLLEKILAIFAYIFTGLYTLKLAKTRLMQTIGYLGAIGWIMLIVKIATSKAPVFLL